MLVIPNGPKNYIIVIPNGPKNYIIVIPNAPKGRRDLDLAFVFEVQKSKVLTFPGIDGHI